VSNQQPQNMSLTLLIYTENTEMGSTEKGNLTKNGLWFSMFIEEEEFIAFIPDSVLETHFNAHKKKKGTVAIYKENRERIHSIAQKKFREGHTRPIKLDDADFI